METKLQSFIPDFSVEELNHTFEGSFYLGSEEILLLAKLWSWAQFSENLHLLYLWKNVWKIFEKCTLPIMGGSDTRRLKILKKFIKFGQRKTLKTTFHKFHEFFARICTTYNNHGNFSPSRGFGWKNSSFRILEMLLLQIEPSEITSFFYKNLSIWGERSLCYPLARAILT